MYLILTLTAQTNSSTIVTKDNKLVESYINQIINLIDQEIEVFINLEEIQIIINSKTDRNDILIPDNIYSVIRRIFKLHLPDVKFDINRVNDVIDKYIVKIENFRTDNPSEDLMQTMTTVRDDSIYYVLELLINIIDKHHISKECIDFLLYFKIIDRKYLKVANNYEAYTLKTTYNSLENRKKLAKKMLKCLKDEIAPNIQEIHMHNINQNNIVSNTIYKNDVSDIVKFCKGKIYVYNKVGESYQKLKQYFTWYNIINQFLKKSNDIKIKDNISYIIKTSLLEYYIQSQQYKLDKNPIIEIEQKHRKIFIKNTTVLQQYMNRLINMIDDEIKLMLNTSEVQQIIYAKDNTKEDSRIRIALDIDHTISTMFILSSNLDIEYDMDNTNDMIDNYISYIQILKQDQDMSQTVQNQIIQKNLAPNNNSLLKIENISSLINNIIYDSIIPKEYLNFLLYFELITSTDYGNIIADKKGRQLIGKYTDFDERKRLAIKILKCFQTKIIPKIQEIPISNILIDDIEYDNHNIYMKDISVLIKPVKNRIYSHNPASASCQKLHIYFQSYNYINRYLNKSNDIDISCLSDNLYKIINVDIRKYYLESQKYIVDHKTDDNIIKKLFTTNINSRVKLSKNSKILNPYMHQLINLIDTEIELMIKNKQLTDIINPEERSNDFMQFNIYELINNIFNLSRNYNTELNRDHVSNIINEYIDKINTLDDDNQLNINDLFKSISSNNFLNNEVISNLLIEIIKGNTIKRLYVEFLLEFDLIKHTNITHYNYLIYRGYDHITHCLINEKSKRYKLEERKTLAINTLTFLQDIIKNIQMIEIPNIIITNNLNHKIYTQDLLNIEICSKYKLYICHKMNILKQKLIIYFKSYNMLNEWLQKSNDIKFDYYFKKISIISRLQYYTESHKYKLDADPDIKLNTNEKDIKKTSNYKQNILIYGGIIIGLLGTIFSLYKFNKIQPNTNKS